jgi:hypothetical protein
MAYGSVPHRSGCRHGVDCSGTSDCQSRAERPILDDDADHPGRFPLHAWSSQLRVHRVQGCGLDLKLRTGPVRHWLRRPFIVVPNTSGSAFNGGIGLYSIANSPDGGNFVAIDGDPRFTAPLLQTISGLTVGREYQLSFLQASGQQKGDTGITAQQWNVTFGGGVGQLSTLMLTPSQGSTPWTLQTMDFTASSASEVLNFMASGVGAPPVALLADVSLTAIPEPTTWVLMALGFGGLGLAAYRRTKKVAALAD